MSIPLFPGSGKPPVKSPKAEGGIRKRKCGLGGGAGVRIVRYFDENAGMRDPDRLLHIGRSRTGLKSLLHPRYYKSVFFSNLAASSRHAHAQAMRMCGARAVCVPRIHWAYVEVSELAVSPLFILCSVNPVRFST